MKPILLSLFCLLLLVLAGCRGAPPETKDKQEMNVIRNSFQGFYVNNSNETPSGLDDLQKYVDLDEQPVFEKAKNGDIVVNWHLREAEMKASDPPVIVAFRKECASAGGPVLYSDLTVKVVSATNSPALPKPKCGRIIPGVR